MAEMGTKTLEMGEKLIVCPDLFATIDPGELSDTQVPLAIREAKYAGTICPFADACQGSKRVPYKNAWGNMVGDVLNKMGKALLLLNIGKDVCARVAYVPAQVQAPDRAGETALVNTVS